MKQNSRLKLIWVAFLFLAVMMACTESSKPAINKPSLESYKRETQLMLKVADKFMAERDIKKLHEVAVATELTRAMACIDFSGECDAYAEFNNQIVSSSSDGVISPSEKMDLNKAINKLRLSIKQGIDKINRDL